jgi:hypothetical protein
VLCQTNFHLSKSHHLCNHQFHLSSNCNINPQFNKSLNFDVVIYLSFVYLSSLQHWVQYSWYNRSIEGFLQENQIHSRCYTVIHFCPKLQEFLRFSLNRNFEWIWCSEVSVAKNSAINTRSFGRTKKILYKTNNFVLKTRNSSFKIREVSVRKKPEVLLEKTRSFGSKTRSFGSKTRSFGSKPLSFG